MRPARLSRCFINSIEEGLAYRADLNRRLDLTGLSPDSPLPALPEESEFDGIRTERWSKAPVPGY
jgi:hypothetical protein